MAFVLEVRQEVSDLGKSIGSFGFPGEYVCVAHIRLIPKFFRYVGTPIEPDRPGEEGATVLVMYFCSQAMPRVMIKTRH